MTTKVLVLCTGNSCRSIMTEALINAIGAGRYEAVSAGSNPAGYVHPKSIETLKRHGLDPGEPRSKSWDEFAGQHFDLVITVCDAAAAESCPAFLGKHEKLHWSTPDPAKATGTEEEVNAAFDAAFGMLREKIKKLLLDLLIEELCCLRFASMDIEKSSHYINIAETQIDKKVAFPILEVAIIAYARPFLKCQVEPDKRRKLIDTNEIPSCYHELHEGLINYRDKYVAHTDIDIRNPKFARWNKTGETPWFPMNFKMCEIKDWHDRIDDIAKLLAYLNGIVLQKIKDCEFHLDKQIEKN